MILFTALTVAAAMHAEPPKADAPAPVKVGDHVMEPFKLEIPGAAYSLDMIPVPANAAKKTKAFWISKTEVTWEAYDPFVYNKDDEKEAPLGADVCTRPSRPYIPPDSGFGKAGMAAICVSFKSAGEYGKWLSARKAMVTRLPTEAEWEVAAAAGSTGPFSFGDDATKAGEYAWFADNSEDSPHKVATKKPNALGLYDMTGNVSEWVTADDSKKIGGVVKGGSWMDDAESLKTAWRAEYDIKWQKTDPQIPKSKWWMSDGQHVGLRIVIEVDEKTGKPLAATKSETKPDSKPETKPDTKPEEPKSK